MTIRSLIEPAKKPDAILTAPPSNPPIDAAEFERRLDQMHALLGR